MILKRLREAIGRQDWFAVVLEVVVVIVGVLIALAANDYAANQAEREFELNSLSELRGALLSDLEGATIDFEIHRNGAQHSSWLRQHIEEARPYSDTLGQYFWSVRGGTIWAQDEAPYRTLQQRGMSTIRNDSLRIAIGRYYGYEKQAVIKSQDSLRKYLVDNVVPFYHEHFVDRYTPVDYGQLTQSTEFKYILDYASGFHAAVAELLEQSIAQTENLIAMIDHELRERGYE